MARWLICVVVIATALTFGASATPPPLKFWTATKGEAYTRWLPDDEFQEVARQHGIPLHKGGFAVWGRWWKGDEIFLRASRLRLFAHEARHIEEQSDDFHGEQQ